MFWFWKKMLKLSLKWEVFFANKSLKSDIHIKKVSYPPNLGNDFRNTVLHFSLAIHFHGLRKHLDGWWALVQSSWWFLDRLGMSTKGTGMGKKSLVWHFWGQLQNGGPKPALVWVQALTNWMKIFENNNFFSEKDCFILRFLWFYLKPKSIDLCHKMIAV